MSKLFIKSKFVTFRKFSWWSLKAWHKIWGNEIRFYIVFIPNWGIFARALKNADNECALETMTEKYFCSAATRKPCKWQQIGRERFKNILSKWPAASPAVINGKNQFRPGSVEVTRDKDKWLPIQQSCNFYHQPTIIVSCIINLATVKQSNDN